MASTDPQALPNSIPMPGDGLDAARMPGHWLLARLGKRVLRPGGLELTRWMLDNLALGPDDRVVELAAGLGATARLTLARNPGSYTAVDRDPAAVAGLGTLTAPSATEVAAVRADAADTGLPTGSATVVYGEAMLSMQPEPAKRRIVREAHAAARRHRRPVRHPRDVPAARRPRHRTRQGDHEGPGRGHPRRRPPADPTWLGRPARRRGLHGHRPPESADGAARTTCGSSPTRGSRTPRASPAGPCATRLPGAAWWRCAASSAATRPI